MDDFCIAPQEMKEGDLVAFIEGEASPLVQVHLVRCRACQLEAESLQLLLQQVRPGYDRAACPDAEAHPTVGSNAANMHQRNRGVNLLIPRHSTHRDRILPHQGGAR